MGPDPGFSTFNADVRGTVNERISGTASAGNDAWTRQFATQVNFTGETINVIALIGDGGRTISFTRPGAEFPVGTFKLGSITTELGMPKGGFASAYVVRRPNAFQVFFADSGSITVAQADGKLTGTFSLYASTYQVLPIPTPETSGQPITPLETGEAAISITGSFAAVRR